MYGKSSGFVLGSGDPTSAKYALILESPSPEDLSYRVDKPSYGRDQDTVDAEMETRRRAYPSMDERFLKFGYPAQGGAGIALKYWIMQKVGIRFEDCYIDHIIRCCPPRGKSGNYPTGEVKKAVEAACRVYDRIEFYRPDTILFGLNPSSLIKEITPLPLAVKDFEKLRDFTSQGRRVLMLLGGKATTAFARFGANTTRWRGHYFKLDFSWSVRYKELFAFKKKARKGKKNANAISSPEQSSSDG